jgi:pimeloyl-ACP methyl ester carboxylesterase
LFTSNMFSNHYSTYGKSRLHYIKAGNGKQTMLFFHGFGQDHAVYIPIIQTLASDYTVYIFDLYFHGKSSWNNGEKPLDKRIWKEIVSQFLDENKIDSFSLSAFSLGGKFAFATAEAMPEKCKQLFLIAPDGIDTNLWYNFATYPYVSRSLFKSLILNHQRFLSILKFFSKFDSIDKGLIRFADYQMNSEEKRKRVYYSWVVFRRLTFNHRKLAKILNDAKIRVTIVIGKYDPVINPAAVKKFANMIKDVNFALVDAGHTGLLTREIFKTYLLP